MGGHRISQRFPPDRSVARRALPARRVDEARLKNSEEVMEILEAFDLPSTLRGAAESPGAITRRSRSGSGRASAAVADCRCPSCHAAGRSVRGEDRGGGTTTSSSLLVFALGLRRPPSPACPAILTVDGRSQPCARCFRRAWSCATRRSRRDGPVTPVRRSRTRWARPPASCQQRCEPGPRHGAATPRASTGRPRAGRTSGRCCTRPSTRSPRG